MLAGKVFYGGALMLCWTQLCVASRGRQPILDHSPTQTVSAAPRRGPCYVDDALAALREGVGGDGELANSSLAVFGICATSGNPSGSALLALAEEARLEVLRPTGVHVGEDDVGTLQLTFDLPRSHLLRRSPALLLVFEGPVKEGDVDVAFTSPSLQPNTQTGCISAETRYMLLTGRASEEDAGQKWRISVETTSPDAKKNLKELLGVGDGPGSDVNVTPLLLFPVGADTRHGSDSSSLTFFLCELKRFLVDVLAQDHPGSPQLQLSSLHSMPPLSLGPSSSETLLAGLINSSSPTFFSFTGWDSERHELALSPELLEELRRRLEQGLARAMEVISVREAGQRAAERLVRLGRLCVLPEKDRAAGESQFRAFLLLKALQTVAHASELQVGLRTTRAGGDSPARGSVCGLTSLTVSLERHLVGPNTANINNCRGSCTVPLHNTNNHAVLLNSHIESGNAGERALCCVPVAYDPLEVVDLNEHGTYFSIKPDVVAKACGCR